MKQNPESKDYNKKFNKHTLYVIKKLIPFTTKYKNYKTN